MASNNWPPADKRTLLGKRIQRVDGPVKSTGAAKYSSDIRRPGLLYAKLITSSSANATVSAVDLAAAGALPGVKAVWKDEEVKEVQYIGQILGAVVADTEEIATEAASLARVTYEQKPPVMNDRDPAQTRDPRPTTRQAGNVQEALQKADVVHEGEYGCPVITHCCLEPHGQVTELNDAELRVWPSTQNVSGYSDRLGEAVGIDQTKIRVDCQYMGGGFGSKFGFDPWGRIGALLSKQTGRPVKLMLDRDLELMIAGNRPSAFAKVRVGAGKDGILTAMDSEICGTSGMGGSIPLQMPYVFDKIPNTRLVGTRILTNRGSARAWRAPNHPQNCYITMSALADTAAKVGMDELDFFLKNLHLTARPEVYAAELKIAADLIGYRAKAHRRGERSSGPMRRGLGVSIHTWGGMGHPSECDITINPDGSVLLRMGTQDLGVGTRTTLGIVAGETLGLPLEAIQVEIGRNEFPRSGASGGSTTIGGVSASTRIASTDALNALLAVVAPRLNTSADRLEAAGGEIRQTDSPSNRMTWKQACALLGVNAITKRGVNVPGESQRAKLIDSGVGGAQIAEVSVDIETGVVLLEELVAVQDCGLIVDLLTAESQVYGGLIMGITSALFEEAVYDMATGKMLNADMEFYRLAGLRDVGRLKVHMMTGPGYDDRGVIGLGEPPVISPAAAIANAVANAIGVRVPDLPLTPDRVLTAIQKGANA